MCLLCLACLREFFYQGAGESGKSTIVKQMKIIHDSVSPFIRNFVWVLSI